MAGLLLSVLGLGLLLALPGILPNGVGSQLWSVLWLTAVAALLTGVLIVAPVVRGVSLLSLVLLGVILAGLGLVRVGMDALASEQEEAIRDAAALLRYRVAELPSSGVEVAAPLVEKLCESAGGELPRAAPWVCEPRTNADGVAAVTWRQPRAAVRELITGWRRPGERPQPVRELAIARAGAELFVAEQELAAATGTTEVESRRIATETARAALQTTSVERIELAEAVTAGASSVLDGLLSTEGRIPLAIGVAGWFALAALGLATLRWASTRNSTRGLGPVTLDAVENEDEVWGRCREQFRTHLLENVPEPGTVPHADALIQVANLVGAAVPPASGAAKALAAVQKAVVVERGYAVQVAVLRPARGEGGKTATAVGLVVRVRKARTRTLLAQREFRFDGNDESLVVREAAYWAAGVVIEDSRSVPLWARWSQDAVGPLARSEAARSEVTDEGRDRALSELEEAAKRSPASGLLLLKLAHARELDGNLAGAFAYALEAASLYPRHLDARYRLATEASMLAEQLPGAGDKELERCRLAARRYLGDRHPLSSALHGYPRDDETGDALRDALLRFALQERRRTRWWVLSPFALAWHALHASERDLWLQLLLRRRLRIDRQRRLTTAQLVTHQQLARHRPLRPDVRLRGQRQHRLARRGDAVWQQPYNLACFHVRADEYARGEALARQEELARTKRELAQRRRRKQWPSELRRVERRLKRVQAALDSIPGNLEEVRKQHVELARLMLESARVARDSEQLTQQWLRADPDLEPLHGEPWWTDFVDSCRSSDPEPKGAAGPAQPVVRQAAVVRVVSRSAGSRAGRRRPRRRRRARL